MWHLACSFLVVALSGRVSYSVVMGQTK